MIAAPNPFQCTVNVLDATTASVSWTNPPKGNLVLNTISTVGRETGSDVGPTNLPVISQPTVVTGLHAGWQIDFQLIGDGGIESSVATVQMPAATASPPTISRIETIVYYSDGSSRTVTTQP